MGKNLIQQRRGRGTITFRAPSFRYKAEIKFNKLTEQTLNGEIIDLIHCPGHNCPLAKIRYENGEDVFIIAPEGIRVGESVRSGSSAEIKPGNVLPLKEIPEGTSIFNIEGNPGDGGRFVRSSGGFARLLSKAKNKVLVKFPSNKKKEFAPGCRACIGIIAGSGRPEKPFLKAGKKYYAKKAKNKFWPSVSASSMNAVDHPFGGHSSCRHKMPLQSPRNAPPGRKVGKIAPRRTGRKKR